MVNPFVISFAALVLSAVCWSFDSFSRVTALSVDRATRVVLADTSGNHWESWFHGIHPRVHEHTLEPA